MLLSLFKIIKIVMIEFIIIGVPKNQDYNKIFKNEEIIIPYTVLAKSPGISILSQVNDLHLWIFPYQIILYDESLKVMHVRNGQNIVERSLIKTPKLSEKEKHFVLTDGLGKRRYCTSQVYYEKQILIKCQQQTIIDALIGNTRKSKKYFYVPKAICIASDLPYFKIHLEIIRIYEEIRQRNQKALKLSISQQNYKLYVDLHRKRKQDEWDNQILIQSAFDKQLKLLPQFVLSYYLSSVVYYQESHFAEKIVNFFTENKIHHIMTLYPITDSLYDLNGYNQFKFYLSKKNLMNLLAGIFQEKQIAIFSKDTNLIVMFCETIFEILKPFRWEFLYAPSLPESFIDIGESFMPYILGFETSMKKSFFGKFGVENKIIVDIDEDVVIVNTTLIKLPSKLLEYIDTPLIRPRLKIQRITDRETQTKKNFLCMILTMVQDIWKAFIKQNQTFKFSSDIFLKLLSEEELSFYNPFIKQSMMFRKFIQDIQCALNNHNNLNNNNLTMNSKNISQLQKQLSFTSSDKIIKKLSSNSNNSNRQSYSSSNVPKYIHEFLNLIIKNNNLNHKKINTNINGEMHVYLDSKYSKMQRSVVNINCDKDLIRYFFNFNQSFVKFQPFATLFNHYKDTWILPLKKQESKKNESPTKKLRNIFSSPRKIRPVTTSNRLSLTNDYMSTPNITIQFEELLQ